MRSTPPPTEAAPNNCRSRLNCRATRHPFCASVALGQTDTPTSTHTH